MKTLGLKSVLMRGVFALTLGFVFPACQRQCQPPGEVFTTISATPWRLVSTNNPDFKNNNRFTFIIMEFGKDFSGSVKKVVNNREFETPVSLVKYNVETESGRSGTLRIAYSEVAGGGEDLGGEATAGEVTEITDYTYQVGRKLNLTEVKAGYTYEFVPYVGIVDPDSNCSF